MAENGITAAQRAALLREGVVVLEAELEGPRPHIVVTGAGRERVQTLVEQRFGSHVEIDIASDLPRELRPWRCVGHMEREPARLQLRFVLRDEEHVDEILVAEDDDSVVILATVCTPVSGEPGPEWEGPWHVYLDRPLGDRTVIDGSCGASVPYKNVYELLRTEEAARQRR